MKIEIKNLLTIKNYALKEKVTSAYIYKLIKENKLDVVHIDGVFFIDVVKFPSIQMIIPKSKK